MSLIVETYALYSGNLEKGKALKKRQFLLSRKHPYKLELIISGLIYSQKL